MPSKTFNPEAIEKAAAEVAGILRALANERRLMILCKLVEWGEGNRELAGGDGRAFAVRSLSASGENARGGTGDLPAREPDALVSHRRPADRRPLGHSAQALLQAHQSTLKHGVHSCHFQKSALPKPSVSCDQGAILVDIREADEHAREKVTGARHLPLSKLDEADLALHEGKPVIFHCKSGARTMGNASRLAQKVGGACEAFIIEGGLDAWKKAGLPVVTDRRQPIELQRRCRSAPAVLHSSERCWVCSSPRVFRRARIRRRGTDGGRRDRLLRDGSPPHAGAVEQAAYAARRRKPRPSENRQRHWSNRDGAVADANRARDRFRLHRRLLARACRRRRLDPWRCLCWSMWSGWTIRISRSARARSRLR